MGRERVVQNMRQIKKGRGMGFLFIRVLIFLLFSQQCLAKVSYGRMNTFANESFVYNSGLDVDDTDDAVEDDTEAESGDYDNEDSNASTRSRPGDVEDAVWSTWTVKQK